jgi:hypothetical protein
MTSVFTAAPGRGARSGLQGQEWAADLSEEGETTMAKKKGRKRHRVEASMQVLGLTRAGSSLEIEIFDRGSKLGHIILGRGSITWYGRGRHKGKRWGWSRFAQVMDELAYGQAASARR